MNNQTVPSSRGQYALTSRRAAIAFVRAEANGIIEQGERLAKGWDRGAYRDDDTLRLWTIRENLAGAALAAFEVAADWRA